MSETSKNKKRILFVIHEFNVGGVEKSLIALLSSLPADKYDITVGVVNKRGGFLEHVPDHVRVLEIPVLRDNIKLVTGRFAALTHCIRHKRWKDLFIIPSLYVVSRLKKTIAPLYRHYITEDKDSMGSYDIAVAFQGPDELIDFYVSNIVRAERKFGWIHFDIDRCSIRPRSIINDYKKYERIFIVSNDALSAFNRRFPEMADKTEIMLNIIDSDSIMSLAKEAPLFKFDKGVHNLVTVGRTSMQKAQDVALEAARKLKDAGVNFHWYFIGSGPQLDQFRQLASKLSLDDCVTFTGALTNPYPYMAACNVYVQPSRYEGFCIAIGEAKLFGVPIVATDFVGALEQLATVENAIIIPEPAPRELAEAIVKAISFDKISPELSGPLPQVKRLNEIFLGSEA